MEAVRPTPEESLPSTELATSVELPEIRPNRLRKLANKMRRQNDAPKAPEAPPPLLVEQLAAFEKSADKAKSVEFSIEEIPEVEEQRSEARRRLEAAYETQTEEEPAEPEELPEEARYERRAEIKADDPVMTAEEQGRADSVGKILAELHQKTAVAHAAFRRKRRTLKWPASLPVIGKFPVLYQQAMAAGFTAGVALVIGYITITSI